MSNNYIHSILIPLFKICAITTKENILNALKLHKPEFLNYGIQNIGLFGSYLRNEQSEKSDNDLLIDFAPEKKNFDNYMAVYDIFESIFENEKIEVVTKNGLSAHIGATILKEVLFV